MSYIIETLPDEVSSLKQIIVSLKASQAEQEHKYQTQISYLEEQIRLLKSSLFGRKSEKAVPVNDSQCLLFNEAEAGLNSTEEKPVEETTILAHTRKKRGRKPLPPDLPRIEVIHDLKEEEKLCGCGCPLTSIGEDTSEKPNVIPAKIQVIRHIRQKYACKQCEGVESGEATVNSSPAGNEYKILSILMILSKSKRLPQKLTLRNKKIQSLTLQPK